MATNAEHRTVAETWLEVASANYMEVARAAEEGDRTAPDLEAQLEAGRCAAAIAQAHATLSLAPYPGVGRALEILNEWDALSKGTTPTTERIRAALEDYS